MPAFAQPSYDAAVPMFIGDIKPMIILPPAILAATLILTVSGVVIAQTGVNKNNDSNLLGGEALAYDETQFARLFLIRI
jgi:hypothetical protein